LLQRFDFGVEVLDLVMRPGVVERRRSGPGFDEHIQVVVGAGVALVLVDVVAVAPLLGVVAAGDDVHRHAPVREVVQSGQRPGSQRRATKPGRWAINKPKRSVWLAAYAAT
jgi:hypothetical protein